MDCEHLKDCYMVQLILKSLLAEDHGPPSMTVQKFDHSILSGLSLISHDNDFVAHEFQSHNFN